MPRASWDLSDGSNEVIVRVRDEERVGRADDHPARKPKTSVRHRSIMRPPPPDDLNRASTFWEQRAWPIGGTLA